MTNSDHTLQQFVERARTLYSLPAVAVKVLELTSHSQVDLRALKECIENDPAIASKVLRVVNSSLFALSREVSDLNQALALLGIKPLKLLVLGFSLSEAVFTKFTGKIMLRYWRHTLTKAVAAREIAETLCRIPGDEPFIAALLQDLGMLVLLQELGEPYARLLSRPFASQSDLASWEVQSLGFDHTELTARLLASWGFSETLQMAVALGRDEQQTSASPGGVALARILHLAQLLADLLIDERHDLLNTLLEANMPQGHLTHYQLADLVTRLQDKVGHLAEVFSLELPPGLDYRDVLVQAHARMSEVSAELSAELVQRNRPRSEPVCEAATMLEDVQSLSAAVSQFMRRGAGEPPEHAKRETLSHAFSPSTAHHEHAHGSPKPLLAAVPGLKSDDEAGMLNRLGLVAYACRQSRWPLSLALVEVDHFAQLVEKRGAHAAARFARRVQESCRRLDMPQLSCWPLGQCSLAVAIPNCDRHQASGALNRLMQEVRQIASEHGASAPTVSIGLASIDVLPKNFSHQTLYESASRCLSAAQAFGGNTLKSIGI